MKSTLLSIYTLSVLMTSALAAEEAESLREMFSQSHIGGEFRAIYQSNSKLERLDGTNGSSQTGTIGGKMELSTQTYNGFDAVATGYGTAKIGSNRNQTDGDYLNNGKENSNYALLGQAFIRYTYQENFIQAGRFEFDTPLINPEDIRMVPDLFQGVYGALILTEDIRIESGYITHMAGWENGGDNSRFTKIGRLIDTMDVLDTYKVGKSALSFAGISYGNDGSPFSLRIYDYITKNVMNQIYTDMTVSAGMVDIQTQYLRSISDNKFKEHVKTYAIADTMIDSTLWGAGIGVEFKEANLRLNTAYNQSEKKENTLYAGGTPDFFGGANDPLLTSMDVLSAHQLGGVKAYKGEITFNPNDALSLALAHTFFKKEDSFNNKETDLNIHYTVQDNIIFQGVASKVVETDLHGNESINHRVRLMMRIGY